MGRAERNPSLPLNDRVGWVSLRSTHPTHCSRGETVTPPRSLRDRPSPSRGGKRLRQYSPTGKSLLLFGNHVNPQNKKYFALSEGQISASFCPSRPGQKGVGRRHGRWAGSDGRLLALDDGVDG